MGISAVADRAPAADLERRPNIVLMLGDDLRPDGFGALGNPTVKTPNFDALVERGHIFRKAYTMGSMIGAVCMPSRTMLLTGRSLFRAKNEPSGEDPSTYTLPRALRAAGYATCHAGKFGNSPKKITEEFDLSVDPGRSEAVADAMIRFIRDRAGRAPMFLYMAGPEPHDPQYAPPEFYAQYNAEDIPLPAAFTPYHPFDNGWMTGRDEMTLPFPRTPEHVRQKLARYYASISYLDAQFGRVVQALKDAGEYDNTIFVLSADNGLSLGEHGLLGKQNLYEFGGMHVPLVVAGPGIEHRETRALVYLMDLFPTLCAWAGAPVPASVEGTSLAPILRGEADSIRPWLYTAYEHAQRAITDGRWKLQRFPLVDKTLLFDLDVDPRETNDLADDPQHEPRVRAMLDALRDMQRRYDDPAPLQVPDPRPAHWDPSMLTPEQIQFQIEETARCADVATWSRRQK